MEKMGKNFMKRINLRYGFGFVALALTLAMAGGNCSTDCFNESKDCPTSFDASLFDTCQISGSDSGNSIYVASSFTAETDSDGSASYPWKNIDDALTARSSSGSSTVYIYVYGSATAYETNIDLNDSSKYSNTYIVGCSDGTNPATIDAENGNTYTDHTIKLSGISNFHFIDLNIQGIYSEYASYIDAGNDDIDAATVYLENSTDISFEGINFSDNYFIAIKSTGSTTLELDTVDLSDPYVSLHYGNSAGVFMDAGTTLTANNINVTGFYRGVVVYGATAHISADDSSHTISSSNEAGIYFTKDSDTGTQPSGSINGLLLQANYIGIYGRENSDLDIDNVTLEASNSMGLRACSSDSTISDNIVAVSGSSIAYAFIGDVTVSGTGNSFNELTVDPDANDAGDFSSPDSTSSVDCPQISSISSSEFH